MALLVFALAAIVATAKRDSARANMPSRRRDLTRQYRDLVNAAAVLVRLLFSSGAVGHNDSFPSPVTISLAARYTTATPSRGSGASSQAKRRSRTVRGPADFQAGWSRAGR